MRRREFIWAVAVGSGAWLLTAHVEIPLAGH
jgi:hypothetical protein